VPQADPFGDLHDVGAAVASDSVWRSPVFVVVARAATSAGVPSRAPRVRGRPERPVRGGGSSCSTEVTFNRLVQVIRPSTSRRRPT
jgi:hypothetical protein